MHCIHLEIHQGFSTPKGSVKKLEMALELLYGLKSSSLISCLNTHKCAEIP
jgi:hypothetical protein